MASKPAIAWGVHFALEPPIINAVLPPTPVGTPPASGALAWRPSLVVIVGWAILVGTMMSAQMLFQPFVWRNWPWDEVLSAWLEIAALRVAVALVIGLALFGAWRVPARSVAGRAGLLASAIAIGATAAEEAFAHWGFGTERAFWQRFVNWNVVAGSVSGMFYLWRRSSDARDAAQAFALRHAQMQQQVVEARLQALRSQIEPHFLFNTLATLRSLQRHDPGQGAQLMACLLEYLRATAPQAVDDRNTLRHELALVRGYLGVVAMRMSGRLVVDLDIDDALLDCAIPALVVATLVENAVKHGLAPAPAGGRLCVTAQRHGDTLDVCVADTGVGFGGGTTGSGLGLANVRARLQTLYGSAGVLTLRANRPRGVSASIRLPLRLVGGCA